MYKNIQMTNVVELVLNTRPAGLTVRDEAPKLAESIIELGQEIARLKSEGYELVSNPLREPKTDLLFRFELVRPSVIVKTANENVIPTEDQIREKLGFDPRLLLESLEVSKVDISVRLYNCLKDVGANLVGEAVQYTFDGLKYRRNFGRRSYNELVKAVEGRGMQMGMVFDSDVLAWCRAQEPSFQLISDEKKYGRKT